MHHGSSKRSSHDSPQLVLLCKSYLCLYLIEIFTQYYLMFPFVLLGFKVLWVSNFPWPLCILYFNCLHMIVITSVHFISIVLWNLIVTRLFSSDYSQHHFVEQHLCFESHFHLWGYVVPILHSTHVFVYKNMLLALNTLLSCW